MNYAEIIKQRRAILKISQQDLADFSGIGLRTIKMIELNKANPTMASMQKIAEVLGLELVLQVRKL